MAVIIPIKNNPNHTLIIELESVIYKLGFLYNVEGAFWSMTIWDENDNLLIAGIKIVANYPLLFSHINSSLPPGDFYCEIADTSASINRTAFSSGEAKLLYLTQEEVETI
jgi:hypothetical protein